MQYSAHLSKEAIKFLEETEEEVSKLVLLSASKLENTSPSSKKFRDSIKKLEDSISSVRGQAWKSIDKLLDSELKELMVDETAMVSRIISESLPVQVGLRLAPDKELKEIAVKTPFEGKILKDHIKSAASNDVQRITTRTNKAIVQNNVPSEVLKQVIGSQAYAFKDGVTRRAWDGAEALVFTSTSHVQSQSKSSVYKTNEFLIKEEDFQATLDSRTTPQCITADDGSPYKVGEGPMPPLHWRCRSIRTPRINFEEIAERPFDPTTERTLVKEYTNGQYTSRDALPRGQKTKFDTFARKRKRELVGRVPSKTTYSEWLRGQSKDFQEEVLGVTRAKLFRANKYSVDRYTNASGQFLTLEQLKKKGFDIE